jgi:hypothetical protein
MAYRTTARVLLGALFLAGGALVSGCSSAPATTTSGGGADGGPSGATDSLTVHAGALIYTYQCAEQPLDATAGPRIVTTGCGWPSTNPRVEIDFALQGGQPMNDVSIDLSSSTAPTKILFTAALSQADNLNNVSIYSAFGQGGLGVPAGTSGVIHVRSYDPSSGKMDVVATNVVVPVSTFNAYPGAPSTLTVASAEIVR